MCPYTDTSAEVFIAQATFELGEVICGFMLVQSRLSRKQLVTLITLMALGGTMMGLSVVFNAPFVVYPLPQFSIWQRNVFLTRSCAWTFYGFATRRNRNRMDGSRLCEGSCMLVILGDGVSEIAGIVVSFDSTIMGVLVS